MRSNVRKHLLNWVRESLALDRAFRRVVLVGMLGVGGCSSSHLSLLAGLVGVRMLVGEFAGVLMLSRERRHLEEALPVLEQMG